MTLPITGTITADHMAFRETVADVRRAAEQLRSDRDRVARRVDALLDGGWRGAAATSYAEAWTDWTRAADTVLDGLAAMGDLLQAVDASLRRTDVTCGADLGRLTARLG